MRKSTPILQVAGTLVCLPLKITAQHTSSPIDEVNGSKVNLWSALDEKDWETVPFSTMNCWPPTCPSFFGEVSNPLSLANKIHPGYVILMIASDRNIMFHQQDCHQYLVNMEIWREIAMPASSISSYITSYICLILGKVFHSLLFRGKFSPLLVTICVCVTWRTHSTRL